MSCILHLGDCLEYAKTLDGNCIDSIVTDPPYGLRMMNKKWDYAIPGIESWAEFLRIAKPGAMLFAFGGTRTAHRLACVIEDAGWIIRDQMQWIYSQGFPKSANISKMIDKAAGVRGHDSVGFNVAGKSTGLGVTQRPELRSNHPKYQKPSGITDNAKAWDGYGTNLKPAYEPIIIAMKPLDGTYAENALK